VRALRKSMKDTLLGQALAQINAFEDTWHYELRSSCVDQLSCCLQKQCIYSMCFHPQYILLERLSYEVYREYVPRKERHRVIAKAKLFEIKTDRVNWGSGLRVVVALFVPLIVLGVLGLTQYWPNVSFGALFVGISDILTLKAPIGYRMRRLGIITLAGALLTVLGLVMGVNWELAVLGTFVITLLCGATLAWGKPAAFAAYLINIWFAVSLSFQGGTVKALPLALGWLIGGAFYMLVALVRFERQSSPSEPAQGTAPSQSPKSLFATYFALFRFTSPQFRFVLLKALAVTVGTAIGLGFGLPYAHWIPVYTLVVLQPDYEQTLNIFMQRLIGTILAAALAAVLLVSVQNQYLLALIVVVVLFIAMAMHEANMLIYIFFSTVGILLLLDFSTPGSLTDVWARMLNVFIGALISLVVVYLFMRPSQKTESSSVASG
jgi:Fusaric acid resistance protein-like